MVDDGNELAQRYRRVLESRGYKVVPAYDYETAVKLATESRFDVVVSDWDEHEECVCAALRRIHRQRQDLPLVLLANGLGFASAKAAIECGAYRYLLAPVSEEALLKVLVEAIQEHEHRPD